MTTIGQPSFPVAEYEALQSGCGLVELPRWTSISVAGTDRQTFLNNFCTNDVKRLAPGTSCEAFFTNVKGKILGHGLVTCRNEELVIIAVPDQAPRLIEHLDRYVIREHVVLRDTTPEREYILLGGTKVREFVSSLTRGIAAESRDQSLQHVAADVAGISVRCIVWPLFGPRFTCLLEASAADAERLARVLIEQTCVRSDYQSFTASRIEAGMPLFGIDFDDSNFPQEVGRDAAAISFTKGCYLGQETVARIDALGHVNQRIRGVRFFGQDVPAAGTELTRAGTKAGHVTSATFSPRLGAPLALAMVRREANAIGVRLESRAGECELVPLPLGD